MPIKQKPENVRNSELTGIEFEALFKDGGHNQSSIARTLGGSVRGIRDYVSGRAPIPIKIEYAVRWIVANNIPDPTPGPAPASWRKPVAPTRTSTKKRPRKSKR